MNEQEKLLEIADILELDIDDINPDDTLSELETWDSVAVLSCISVMNEKFNKFPSAKEIRKYQTIRDLMEAMC